MIGRQGGNTDSDWQAGKHIICLRKKNEPIEAGTEGGGGVGGGDSARRGGGDRGLSGINAV